MKKVILANIAWTLSAVTFGSPALAQQCIETPSPQNPRTCMISTSGGVCEFGHDEDGIVRFPDEVVNGQVAIIGGRNVHLVGGHVVAPKGAQYAVAFDYPTNIFVEGMHVDANGQCDAFAIRNHRQHQIDVTFQNVYAEGPAYNNPDVAGNCHGDLIQNQGELVNGGLALHVENFVGVTNGQGFFIPHRAFGVGSVDLRNVYIRMPLPRTFTYPLLWLYAPELDTKDHKQNATLDNVNIDWSTEAPQLYTATGTYANDTYSFDQPGITGIVDRWYPDGNDLDYPAHTGLNYDRAWFCSEQVAESPPETEPILEPEPAPELTPEPAPDVTQADTEAPSVQFDSPSDGSSIRRRSDANIQISAGDNVAVAEVELRIQGRRVAKFVGPGPHSYDWNVRGWGRTKNLIFSAEAMDTSGNISETSVSVNVTR